MLKTVLYQTFFHTMKMFSRDIYVIIVTVEPPIKDPLRRGHNKNNLSTNDTLQSPNVHFPIFLIRFEPSKEQTTSLQKPKWLAPTCPLFRGSTVLIIIIIIYHLCLHVLIKLCVVSFLRYPQSFLGCCFCGGRLGQA